MHSPHICLVLDPRRRDDSWLIAPRLILQLFVLSTLALLGADRLAAERQGDDPAKAGRCPLALVEHPLPADMQHAKDVRWAGEESVFVASAETGVFRLDLSSKGKPPMFEVEKGNRLDGIWLPWHLGVSEDLLVVGAPVFALGWKKRTAAALEAQVAFAAVVDIDVHRDRVLILGAQRDEEGRFAEDGAIGWVGPLTVDLDKLQPVLYSADGPRVRSMNGCGLMEMGSVRFLSDGSFVIAPGVEPGIKLFDPGGKLIRTWQSEKLGLDAGCDLTDKEVRFMAAKEEARWAWTDERRIVDDILPLPEGPGLLVRTRGADTTTWELKVLHRDGQVISCDVPISSKSSLAQLHGDVAGGRVVFLLWLRGTAQWHTDGLEPRLFTSRLGR